MTDASSSSDPATANASPGGPLPDPDDERVETRAGGRPPEEASSDDPESQARTILAESEARVARREADAEPGGATGGRS